MRQAVLMFFGGAATLGLSLYMDYSRKNSVGAFGDAPYFFTVIGCLAAIIFSGCGIWIWHIRNVPLSIDLESGAIHFGNRLLCSEGTVQSVVLKCPSNLTEDEDSYFIAFQLKDRTIVEIPTPLFVALGNFAGASALAVEMAAKLKVDVVHDF